MVRTEFRAVLCNDPYEIQLMQNLYDSAVKQLSLKFEILNNEFKVLYASPSNSVSAVSTVLSRTLSPWLHFQPMT